jgi:hypothetical protein
VLHRLAGELEVVLGQLPRGLDGLAATAGEEDPVQVAGRVRRDPLGQLDRVRVRVGPQRHERQLLGLPGRRLGQVGPAVAELAHEEAGQRVEVALAVHVVDVGALAAHDHGYVVVLVRAVPGEVQPQVVLGGLLELCGVECHVPMMRCYAPNHHSETTKSVVDVPSRHEIDVRTGCSGGGSRW